MAGNRRTRMSKRPRMKAPSQRPKPQMQSPIMEKKIEALLKELQKGPPGITGAPPPKSPTISTPRQTFGNAAKQPTFRKIAGRKRKRGRRAAGKQLAPKKEYQTETLVSVSRRGQPQVRITVPRLKESADLGGMVSSSWIGEIYWYHDARMAYMVLLNGYEYEVYIPFPVLKKWYWAHSKGTFFNSMIKGKFKVVRVI